MLAKGYHTFTYKYVIFLLCYSDFSILFSCWEKEREVKWEWLNEIPWGIEVRAWGWGDEQVRGLVEATASWWVGEKIVSKAEAWHYWRRELRIEKEKDQGVGMTVRLLSLFFKWWGWKMPMFCLIRYFRFGARLAGGARCGPRFFFYLKMYWTTTLEELLK